MSVMKVTLCLGSVVFSITIDREIILNPGLERFLMSEETKPDVSVQFVWEWDEKQLPCMENYLGKDSLLKYFRSKDRYYAWVIADEQTYQARTEYTPDCEHIECYINEARCHERLVNVGTLLRFLPMRAVFDRFGILFFHASQIAYRGKGILFTAPSGTGKTTQAKLWRDCRGAELVCNDRTLIRRTGEKWMTYGYPLDGSEPVRSTKVMTLGAIVLLHQGKENRVERLHGAKAVAELMSQLVLDAWDVDARMHAVDRILDVMKEIPVYRLSCRPEPDAVICLEEKLWEDGVLTDENNS